MIQQTEELTVNIGPQHPSTHGVFRAIVTLEGEMVTGLRPVLGYLHRNHEQLAEVSTYIQSMPYTDRLDYFNSMANNYAYALAVEALAEIEVPERANYIRALMNELTRILNHAAAVGFLLNDMGAWQTPLAFGMREREKILDRHFGELRRQLDVDVGGPGDRREIGPVGNPADIEIGKNVGVAEDILQGLQFGDVMPRFLGHRQAQIVGRQTIGPVFVDRFADSAFAPVVRSQRQMPVAVQIVDVLQIIECSSGRSDDVTASVDPPVLFELVLLAGCRNELPQTGSMAARVRGRIVSALYHR